MRHLKLLLISLFVIIGVTSNAQTLLNESFDSGIPADWTVVDNNTDGQTWAGYEYDGNTDSYSASIQSWTSHDDYLITSQLSVSEGTKLSFAVKSHSSSYLEAMEVLVSTSTNDVADFTIQLADYPSIPYGWNEYEIVLTDNASINAGDNIYIGFRCYSVNEYYIYLDDVKVFTPVADDLGVASIAFDPSTVFDGDEVTITATIENNGTNDQTSQNVDFIIDGSSIGTQSLDLTAGNTAEVSMTWTATEGSHSVEVTVPTDDDDSNISFTESITAFSATALIESFEGTWPPAGWEADYGWGQNTWSPYEGLNNAYISNSGVKRLMTPKLVINGSSAINFWAKTGFGDYDIKLVYSTDKTTWTDVPSGTISLSSTYQNFNIDLSSITAGNYFIAFEYNLSYTSVYLDYIVGPEKAIELPEAATNPTPPNNTLSVAETTDLSWDAASSGGIPTGYKVYFGTDGEGTSTPTNIENGTEITETTYTPSSVLEYGTTYYWQIIPTNSLGDATNCPIWKFTTISNPLSPIPFSEDFTGVTAYSLPSAWTATNIYVYSDHGVGGTECLSVNMWSSTSTADVTTPPVGPLSATANQVKFDYRICNSTYGSYPETATELGASDKVEVMLSTDNGNNFTTIHTIDQNNHVTSLDFVSVTLNLDAAYNSENIKLRFKNTWGQGDYNVDIDNVIIREQPTDPVLTASTDTLTFFNLLTNIAYTKTVTISNDGGGTLTIADGDLAITGTNADDFSLGTITYPIELATTETFDIEIIFNSSIEGEKEASLEITHNGTKITTSIGLVGSTYNPYATYSQNFDATAEDEIPEKWSMITPGFSGVYVIEDGFSTYSYSSPNSLAIVSGGSTPELPYAITPAFEMGNKRLKFFAKRGSYEENIIVGTITDPTDENTFTEIETIAISDTHTEYAVDFDSYTGDDKYVAFKHGNSRTYNAVYIDNLSWSEIPTTPICEVTPLTIDFGEATVAEIDTDIITIKNAGINTLTITETDFTFTGTNPDEFSIGNVSFPIELGSEETIDVTVNFIPQTGGAKTANLEINHNGNNGLVTVALQGTGFEGYVEDFNQVGTTFPPAGWTAQEGWKALTFSTYEGAGGVWFNPSNVATDAKLITPLLDVNTGDTFSFWTKKSNEDATFTVKYTADTTSGGTWTDLETFTITNTDYEEKTVDISSLEGEYYIAIAGSGVAFTSTYIDYVKAPSLAGMFDIEFNVTEDGSGDPIEGAVVEINGETDTTDASGYAVLSANNGTHSYSISHNMYENVTGSVVVNSAAQSIDISMTALTGYTVTFNVVDEDAIAFENANINIAGMDLTTDASGMASLTLADGEYPYTVTATGYAEVVDTLIVNGADLTENITLYEVYTMNFVVTDGTNPVAGAFVVVGGAVLNTDANGEANINALNGTYYYTVTKAYYETVSGEITIDGADATANVVIKPVYYIDFTITDENSDAIEGAAITIEDSTITTNASGFASIELADGTYNYSIVKSGFETISNSFTVSGANIEINETMLVPQTTYTVAITVKDQDDVVLEGANVELTDGTDTWTATTDASGMVTFDEKANGTYNYSVSMADYEPATGDLTIADADMDMTINIQYVSINDINNIEFTVYPNPSNGSFKIKAEGSYQILVMNAIGNIIKTANMTNEYALDISNHPKGIYFVKIYSNSVSKTQRIILE